MPYYVWPMGPVNINLLNKNVMDNNSYWVPLRTFIETNVMELRDIFTTSPSSHVQRSTVTTHDTDLAQSPSIV